MKTTRPFCVALASTSYAYAAAIRGHSTSAIEWGACNTLPNTTTNLLCGTLEVPVDYTKQDASEMLELKLVKSPAKKGPPKGTVLYNPGGPGYAGRNSLHSTSDIAHMVIGGYHDIVTWDFRGTGDTLPFTCFPDETGRSTYYSELVTLAANASDTSLGQVWATMEWLAASCAGNPNATAVGELIGTVFTARDMMQIVDALDEDGLLRYWGVSIGSALGETVAAMFPERMDKVLIDAVPNPSEYWAGRSVSQVNDFDATVHSYLAECLKAPELCPLAAQANTAEELERKLYDLLNSVKAEPIVLGEYGIYTYGTLKPTIMAYLYSPANYPMPALYLDSLLTRNVTQFSQYIQANLPSTAPSTTPFPDIAAAGGQENTQGIRCSDEALRASNLSDMMPLVEDWYSESKFGDTAMIYHGIACAKWRFQAKERYTGGFEEIVTKNPMLVVANSFDPITSKAGARNASAAFPGSRVLINGGHGHSLISQPSHCTVRAINAYFLDGSLPENGTFCPASVSTFTTKTIQEVLASFDEADD